MNAPKILSFKCHRITGGVGVGEAILSRDNICFSLTDPETGAVIEKNHSLQGQSVAHRVVIFPGGKGSSVVQAAGLYYLSMKGTGPKALIIQHPDTVLVASVVMLEIPLVDRVEEEFYRQVRNGSLVKVDADNEVITLMPPR
jgi:predicted aconitase with swiveling domain